MVQFEVLVQMVIFQSFIQIDELFSPSVDLFWRHFFARGNTNVATSELGLTKKITFYQKVSKRVVLWYVRSDSQEFGETKWCDLIWPVNVIWFDRWSEMIQFERLIQIISIIDTFFRFVEYLKIFCECCWFKIAANVQNQFK